MRSLRAGRPATVPDGVRDPSGVRPGRLGSASVLEVRLLGGLSAAVDGRPVQLPADARARELLARLALSPGPHSRSVLAGRLRPDVPEDSARKTLRNALYELRRALGPAGRDAVVVTGQRVGLSEAVRVDVREFRGRLADGDLEAAADAGQGELLDGFDGDWALRARDEHAVELAGVLATLAARAEEAGDLPGAVAWARRRLDVEPLAEAAHRELIRLLALDGDRPAALAAAGALSERLRSELGIPPSAATRALVEDVRRARIAPPAAAADAASPPALPAALAAVEHPEGRGPALARLEQAWADAVAGALRFALITGEPGIGKTTLAGELARRVHAQGGAVLLGRSDEHALVPFQPWIEALEALLEALPAADVDHWLTAHDGALARLLPARSAALSSRTAIPASATSRSSWCARCSTTWPRAARSCSCSTTCTGPTRTRSPCCATSRDPRRAGGCSSPSVRGRPSSSRAPRRRSPSCGARDRSSTSTWPASTTTRWPRCSPGAPGRPTSRPPVACARAAAATRSSSTSCCARRRSPAATPRARRPGCAT